MNEEHEWGIEVRSRNSEVSSQNSGEDWIPAFTGMTEKETGMTGKKNKSQERKY